MDVFSVALDPGRALDLDEQRSRAVTREHPGDGAPPYGRIDLASGVAVLDVPRWRGETVPSRNLGVILPSRRLPTVVRTSDEGSTRERQHPDPNRAFGVDLPQLQARHERAAQALPGLRHPAVLTPAPRQRAGGAPRSRTTAAR